MVPGGLLFEVFTRPPEPYTSEFPLESAQKLSAEYPLVEGVEVAGSFLCFCFGLGGLGGDSRGLGGVGGARGRRKPKAHMTHFERQGRPRAHGGHAILAPGRLQRTRAARICKTSGKGVYRIALWFVAPVRVMLVFPNRPLSVFVPCSEVPRVGANSGIMLLELFISETLKFLVWGGGLSFKF